MELMNWPIEARERRLASLIAEYNDLYMAALAELDAYGTKDTRKRRRRRVHLVRSYLHTLELLNRLHTMLPLTKGTKDA